jgi:hypothetical protein
LESENLSLKSDLDATRAELAQLKVTADRLAEQTNALLFPPGHFYSPIPDVKELRSRFNEIFRFSDSIPESNFMRNASFNCSNCSARSTTSSLSPQKRPPAAGTSSRIRTTHTPTRWFSIP